jgi:hypothetical protein
MEVPVKFKSALSGLRYWLLALLFLTTSTFLLSCSSDSSITIVKGPNTIQITVSSDTTHPNEQVTVIATVLDDNNDPVVGANVEFSITVNNSNGTLTPLEGVTDENGQITVIYTAGLDSDVTDVISATVTIKTDDGDLVVSGTVIISVEPTLVGSIIITAGSGSLVADGTSETPPLAQLSARRPTRILTVLRKWHLKPAPQPARQRLLQQSVASVLRLLLP